MKKIFMIAAAVAGLFAAASCQKESAVSLTNGEKATVTFTVALPDAATKVMSDGLSADVVYWAAFDENGGALEGMNGEAVVTDKNATFDVILVKHYTYKFVFWAQDSDCTAYDLTAFNAEGKVSVSYEGAANDESRDAFYRQADVMIEAAGEVKTIELYRPFAQINFLAADYKAIEAVGLQNGMTSTVKIAGLPTVLNGLDGTVDALTGETELDATAVPADPAYYTVNGEEYAWYSMNYVLAAVEKDVFTSAVTGVFNHAKKSDIEIPVANVPYQRNYRTNIIGNYFTDNVTINLVVMEQFNEPDYFVEADGLVSASTADEINAALEGGYDVVLAGDIEASAGIVQNNGGTIDGEGYTLNLNNNRGNVISTNGGTIKDLNVEGGYTGIVVTDGENSSKVYLENVVVDGASYAIDCDEAAEQGLEATGCTFNGRISYGDSIGEVAFTDCSFSNVSYNPYNRTSRLEAPTTFTGCDFAAGYQIDARAEVVFENCTIAGEALTNRNLRNLVSEGRNNVTIK